MKKTNILLLLITAILILSCQNNKDKIEPPDIVSDLQIYYTFNGDPDDKSGNNNECIPVGVTFTKDRFGNDNSAYHFEGDSHYIELPRVISLKEDPWSYSLWFNLEKLPSEVNDAWFLSNMAGDRYDDVYIYVDNEDNTIKSYLATNDRIYSGVEIDTNKWYHIAITHEIITDTMQRTCIYVNGQYKDAGGSFTTVLNSNYIISSISSDGTGRIYGAVDEVRLYKRALSEFEIGLIYTTEKRIQ